MCNEGTQHLRHSIVRRSAGVMGALAVCHALNYALMWEANHLLDSGRFGLFYTSILIINIVLSPMLAVMLVLTRRLGDAGARGGRPQVIAITWYLLGSCLRALPLVAVAAALLAGGAWEYGFEAWVAFLIPLTVLALLVTEILSAAFQAMLLFAWQNTLWIAGSALKLVLATTALWLVPRVWTGIAGILAAAAVVSAAFIPWFARAARTVRSTAARPRPAALDLAAEWPMIVGYSVFVLLNNIDILAAYWLLPRADLDYLRGLRVVAESRHDDDDGGGAGGVAGHCPSEGRWGFLPPVHRQGRRHDDRSGWGGRRSFMDSRTVASVDAGCHPQSRFPDDDDARGCSHRAWRYSRVRRHRSSVAPVRGRLCPDRCDRRIRPDLPVHRRAGPAHRQIYAGVTCGFAAVMAIVLIAPRPMISGLFQPHVR